MYDPKDECYCCECGELITETMTSNTTQSGEMCDECFLDLVGESLDDDAEYRQGRAEMEADAECDKRREDAMQRGER